MILNNWRRKWLVLMSVDGSVSMNYWLKPSEMQLHLLRIFYTGRNLNKTKQTNKKNPKPKPHPHSKKKRKNSKRTFLKCKISTLKFENAWINVAHYILSYPCRLYAVWYCLRSYAHVFHFQRTAALVNAKNRVDLRIRHLYRIKKNILHEIPGFSGLMYWGMSGGTAFVSEKGGVWVVPELHRKRETL